MSDHHDDPAPERAPLAPKLIAGVVCGVAAALPGRFLLLTMFVPMMQAIGGEGDVEAALIVAPVAVGAMVVLITVIAPTVVGAWIRGCLLVTAVSAVLAVQALQCFGIAWLMQEMVRDRAMREAAMAGCAPDLTPGIAVLSIVLAVVFGIATIMIWRTAARSASDEY